MSKKLLLHICCGPCATACFEKLKVDFEITGYFCNPSIWPKEEYDLRLINAQKWAKKADVKILMEKDDYDNWLKMINNVVLRQPFGKLPSGLSLRVEDRALAQDFQEGGRRCEICIKNRLEKTAQKAVDKNYDLFGTTLSISPYKNFAMIKKIGLELEKKYGVRFLAEDFSDLYKRSIELSKKIGLYRQKYCGCFYSRISRMPFDKLMAVNIANIANTLNKNK